MHEFEWNVKQITGWIFDILIYWAISYKNSWSPQLDFIPLALHHICHPIMPYSFHSYEPASQERLVVARAVKNYLHADTEAVSHGLSLSTDQTSLWDAPTCPRTWHLFFLGCKDISSQQMSESRRAFAQQRAKVPGWELKWRVQHSLKSRSHSFRPVRGKTSFCRSWNLPPDRRGHWRQQCGVVGAG